MTAVRARRRGHSNSMAAEEAAALAQGLAEIFGSIACFHVCRADPPVTVFSSAPLRPGDLADVLAAVSDFAAGAPVANRPLGRGARVSVLPLPGARAESLVLAVTVEAGQMARAARVLAALADPGGTDATEATEHLGSIVSRLLDVAESEFGLRASEMSRSQKQQVVKELDERGAFLIKKSVEQVALRLGVSRFTIYNYLDQANREDGPEAAEQPPDGPRGDRTE